MVILKTESEFGHAPPPQTPYSIVSNLPKWENSQKIRDGDLSIMPKVVHIYPRFGPTQYVRQLGVEVAETLGMEGKGALLYLNPDMWPYTRRHATNPHREKHILRPEDIIFRCVDVAGHRLYVILYEPKQTSGVLMSWGNPGVGLSIRGAEQLLQGAENMREVAVGDIDTPPEPTWTPETEAHEGLRDRVAELVNREPRQPGAAQCASNDVFLYPSGMAAVYHSSNTVLQYRQGSIVVIGVVFHNTYHHFVEECPYGFKHFGTVDDKAMEEFESWLEGEAKVGKRVGYVVVEFPGNPTLETPDMVRMKRLSEKYSFVLVADETIAGFANVDLLPYCDILLTSLTKSFSGLANVMGGSIVLNPASPHYFALSPLFTSSHHNELFAPDAAVLLSNSQEFIPRTRILNRNAQAVAAYLTERAAADPECPVVKVRHPSLLPSREIYDRFKRPSSPKLPDPGYGCLLTVDFESLDAAIAFHDNCGFYPSPHLGAHVTIMFAYNMTIFGKKHKEAAYFRELGVKEESVRISVGLEDAEDLVDTLKDALDKVAVSKKNGYKEENSSA